MIAGATWDHLLGDPNYIARIASVTTTSALAVRTGDVERALDAVTEVARRHSRGRAAGDDTALLLVERVAQPADITAGLGSHLRA